MSKPTKEQLAAAVDRYGYACEGYGARESGDEEVFLRLGVKHLKAELDAMLDAALAPPAPPSDLRAQIEAAVASLSESERWVGQLEGTGCGEHLTKWGAANESLAEARAHLSTLLDELDNMAERDAILCGDGILRNMPSGASVLRVTLRTKGVQEEIGLQLTIPPHEPLRRVLRDNFDAFVSAIPPTAKRNTDA